ncbi:unnamed protein product [Rhizophagus irregularis]|nr:unnamed protein product [Rhizophagus irregularis]
MNYRDNVEVVLKCHNNLNENLNEFLSEWKYNRSCSNSFNIIYYYGFTKNPDTLKYMAVMDYANKGNLRGNLSRIVKSGWSQKLYMFFKRAHDIQLSLSICESERPEIIENTPQCYVDLMKKCWDEDPLKRPSSGKILGIIYEWIFLTSDKKIEDINDELKCNIMEFINAPIGRNNLATESHSQAYYTSRLLNFTSKQLNEVLESKNSQTNVQVSERLVSEDLNECMFNLKKLDFKTNEN